MFTFITDFKINKIPFTSIKDFVKQDFESPFLKDARKTNIFAEKKIQNKTKETGSSTSNPFDQVAKSKGDPSNLDLQTVAEDKFNEALEDQELSAEDYQDVSELFIEGFDFLLDKAFIYMNRIPQANSKLLNAKKKRLKIIAGRIMQKYGMKFSLEFLGVIVLASYINARYASTKKKEDPAPSKQTKNKGMVIEMNQDKPAKQKPAEKPKKSESENTKEVKKESKRIPPAQRKAQ